MQPLMKKMLQLGFTVLIIGMINSTYAQRPNRPKVRERIENQEIAFITKQLDLTSDEAKQFWPVFNEFGEKKKALNKEFGPKVRPDKMENLTEAQYKEVIDSQLLREQKLLDLRKEYQARYLSILPASKVFKLYQAEREFKEVLLKKLGDQRRKGGPPPNHPPDRE